MRCYATFIFPWEIKKVFNIIQYLDICSVYKIIVYYFGIEIDEKLIQDVNVPKSPGRRNIQYEVALNIGWGMRL